MSRNSIVVVLLAVLILGSGTAAGGFLLGRGIVAARVADRSVSVKGLAETDVRADLATWRIGYARTGDALGAVQAEVEQDAAAVRDFLTGAGFDAAEISLQRLEVTDLLAQSYRNDRVDRARYIVQQTMRVRSARVDLVNATSSRLGDLVRQGVAVRDFGGPSYLFTSLNDVKPAMIAEATRNARAAAARFAADSGSHVGGIRHASQGQVQILPRDRGGDGERAAIDKTVRVVTTVSYALPR